MTLYSVRRHSGTSLSGSPPSDPLRSLKRATRVIISSRLHTRTLLQSSIVPSSLNRRRGARALSELRLFLALEHGAPGLLPVVAEEIHRSAVSREKAVGHLEHPDHHPAVGPGPRFVPAAGRTPYEFAG